MPGKRLSSVVEMSLRHCNRVKELNKRCLDADVDVEHENSIPDPATPENESCITRSNIAVGVRGSLIHLSRSADGKLMWLPPSSSTTSSAIHCEDTESCGCIPGSEDSSRSAKLVSSVNLTSESSVKRVGAEDFTCYGDSDYSESGPGSPSMTSILHGHVVCEASQVPESSLRSSKSSDISVALQSENSATSNDRDLLSMSHGITPYLSSKLKPGRHVLGVKRNQVFIRPGQLRHWATGNSPSKHVSPTKGKACRLLTF